MYPANRMRSQVVTELKRRRYVFYTLLLLSLLYVALNLAFGDVGLIRYMELKEEKASLGKDLARITENNGKLKASIDSYNNDDFYVEKNAREDFGLADPDEYIFIYK
jgi:cell division protein FtsB